MEITKEKFLQLVKLDDSIIELNLKVGHDGIDATGEIKFFVYGFPDNFGIYFVVDLDKNLLKYQLAKYKEKSDSITTKTFESAIDALIVIRGIIAYFCLFTMMVRDGLL